MWPRCWINNKISQKLFIIVCSTLINTWSEFRPVKARLDSLFNFLSILKSVRKDHFRFYKTITLSFPNLRIWLRSSLKPKTASTTIIIIKYKNKNKLLLTDLNNKIEIISKLSKNNIILKLNTKELKINEDKITIKWKEVNTKENSLEFAILNTNSTLFFRYLLKPPRFIFLKL